MVYESNKKGRKGYYRKTQTISKLETQRPNTMKNNSTGLRIETPNLNLSKKLRALFIKRKP